MSSRAVWLLLMALLACDRTEPPQRPSTTTTSPASAAHGPPVAGSSGGSVAIHDSTRQKLLQRVLDLDLLAPFWHADLPGRKPLAVLENDVVGGAPRLTMFGSDVVYVKKSQAEQEKRPYFVFLKLQSSAGKARVEFGYPAEGVVGYAVFVERSGGWDLEEKHVAER